jgi:hypothetical protein
MFSHVSKETRYESLDCVTFEDEVISKSWEARTQQLSVTFQMTLTQTEMN